MTIPPSRLRENFAPSPMSVFTTRALTIRAWWNLTSRQLKKSEAKLNRKTLKQTQLLSKSGFLLMYLCLFLVKEG